MMLKNKVSIVTGAGQGIGKGIALRLANQGAKVIVSDINLKNCKSVVEEIKEEGGEAIAIKCDVSKLKDVKNLVDETIKEFGSLDVLINNAGIYPFISFTKMKERDWDKLMDINLKSVFLTCSESLKKMKKGSKIVNISSIASLIGFEGLVHYCASKGGVNGFTRALALELAPRGINVNGIAPGAIETPGVEKGLDKKALDQMVASIPAQKMGKPEDIAEAVIFLASDKSNYITGQTLVVDGGWVLR